MNARLSIVAGLMVGVAVAALAARGAPGARPRSAAACDAEPADRHRDREPVGRGLRSAERLPGPSASIAPGPSASSAVGPEAIVRDGALGGIGPDVMATGLETILPGVDVTP